MANRLVTTLAALPATAGIGCGLLGCSIGGGNVAAEWSGDAATGINVSNPIGVQWVTEAVEDGPSIRLLCTSDVAGDAELITCGVHRNAPNATGVPGLVAVWDNGTVAWKDYTISQTTAHPIRSMFFSGGTEFANKDFFVAVDANDTPAGNPYPITPPEIPGGIFSLTSVNYGALIAFAERMGTSVFTINSHGSPGGSIDLEDGESASAYRPIGTPVSFGDRFYVIAQRSDANEDLPICAVFALETHLTSIDRIHIEWVHRFSCPPGELRRYTDVDIEVPLVTRGEGLLFFPSRSQEGRLQLSCLQDNGGNASEVFSVDVDVPGVEPGKFTVRSISALPAAVNETEELLLSFAASASFHDLHGASAIARVSSADGSIQSVYDFSTTVAGSFKLVAGARPLVLPRGMFLPTAQEPEADVAFLAVNASSGREISLLVARLGSETFQIQLSVKLTTLDEANAAKPAIQIVPLDAALAVSVGGSLYGIGEIAAESVVV